MNPTVAVIRNRADALKRQAIDYKSEHCVDLWGPQTASRMALGLHVAARELYRLADDVEAGKINPEEVPGE